MRALEIIEPAHALIGRRWGYRRAPSRQSQGSFTVILTRGCTGAVGHVGEAWERVGEVGKVPHCF